MKKVFLVMAMVLGVVGAGAQNLFQGREGVVSYAEYEPFADRPVEIHYYVPESADQATAQVLFLIPGMGRDAAPLLESVKDKLDGLNVIAFSLMFDAKMYPTPDYQEVGIMDKEGRLRKPEDRTVELPDRIFKFIKDHSDIKAEQYDIYGHSAGGQFIHRFMLLKGSDLVNRAMFGAPGWYTFPDKDVAYPYGLKGTDKADDETIRRFLGYNMILHVGSEDVDRGGVLRKTPEADAQGINRLDRARNFYRYLTETASRLGAPFHWSYFEVPGVPHNSALTAISAIETLYGTKAGNLVEYKTPQNYEVYANVPFSFKDDMGWIRRYEKDVERLGVANTENRDCDVLFLGSSSIVLWRTLTEDMAPLKVVNRGYGGSTLRDQIYNYDRVSAGFNPKAIVIYCDNDIAGNSNDLSPLEYAQVCRVFLDKLHADYPDAPVFLMSMKHSDCRKTLRHKQEIANELLKEMAEKTPWLNYVDATTVLLDSQGNPDNSLFESDFLHINRQGYTLWTQLLKPLLETAVSPATSGENNGQARKIR